MIMTNENFKLSIAWLWIFWSHWCLIGSYHWFAVVFSATMSTIYVYMWRRGIRSFRLRRGIDGR